MPEISASPTRYYTSPLHMLGVETTSAILSSSAVSPFITIIDTSIFANASGKESMWTSLASGFRQLFTRPCHFVANPLFQKIWIVYSGTYLVANGIRGAFEVDWMSSVTKGTKPDNLRVNQDPARIPVFVGTSITNVGLSVWKDFHFTRALAKDGHVMRQVSRITYSMYTCRDTMTIFASFTLPPLVAEKLTSHFSIPAAQASVISQLLTPCTIQFFSSPLHLYGMDVYNRPHQSASQRLTFIAREYLKTSAARVARIFPAYGIGGVLNTKLRNAGKLAF